MSIRIYENTRKFDVFIWNGLFNTMRLVKCTNCNSKSLQRKVEQWGT